MDKPWELNGESVLVVSDVHQRVSWIKAVLDHEAGNYDKFLLNGDIIDCHRDEEAGAAGVRETARFYAWLVDNHNATLGNHDTPYCESYLANSRFAKKIHLLNPCSGYTNSKSIEFNKEMTVERWNKVKLFYVVNGWLVSHAGVNKHFWPQRDSIDASLAALWDQCDDTLRNLRGKGSELLQAGFGRGGSAQFAGLTWQDWSMEFDDELPLPQLVGHTYCANTVRQIGRSFCVDGGTTYAMIKRDGTITFKSLFRQKVDGPWIEREVIRRNDDELIKGRVARLEQMMGFFL